MTQAIQFAEQGWIPECFLRFGMRQLLRGRLEKERTRSQAEVRASLRESPVAIDTDKANEQHYTIPDAFYRITLGPRLKYSCCQWDNGVNDLASAEIASLHQVCARAQLADGQRVLELGCGWGSFSLWAAEHFPNSQFVSVSNSPTQRAYIMAQAVEQGLDNLNVITADINEFEPEGKFDRIVSIEMLEHVRNHSVLFERIARWMNDEALFFAHVFSHKEFAYPFEADGDNDWMARYFFTGGLMPAHDLFHAYNEHLEVRRDWHVNGMHYKHTLDAWLRRMEKNRERVLALFEECYGAHEAERWYHRWRMFFMACSELFGYRDGTEWGVSHYLMEKVSVK